MLYLGVLFKNDRYDPMETCQFFTVFCDVFFVFFEPPPRKLNHPLWTHKKSSNMFILHLTISYPLFRGEEINKKTLKPPIDLPR